MNIVLDTQLTEDSKKIEFGISYLRNELSNVINHYTARNPCEQNVLDEYTADLERLENVLVTLSKEQTEIEKFFSEAEETINSTQMELEQIIEENNIDPGVWKCASEADEEADK